MLDVLPTELSLSIFSYLNIPCLLSLRLVSRQWDTLISENEPAIFHCAAYVHQFIKSEALSLEDELSAGHPGTPWQGSTDWKDFCRRSIQLRRNWEGKGRVAGRLLVPPGRDVHRIKVDERAELCITTHMYGGITVNHLFSGKLLWSLPLNYLRPQAHCEYENGYLVLDNFDGDKEVWRLATDVPHGEVCEKAPPSEAQHGMSEVVAERHQSHAPRGHFRPWALLSLPVPTLAYRLAFPTLLISGEGRAFVYDVCTGALLQTINIGSQDVNYVDVNEQYVFVCSPRVLRIFARKGGNLVLQIPSDASISRVFTVKDPSIIPGDPFVAPLPLIKVSTKGEYIGFRAGAQIVTHIYLDTSLSFPTA
ncbi:hypothetical protein BC834DRAFT_336441 [Gloeopeniophorella convolvens]|nr:hypothetical protein BC834DRAFT_336441 [Gloeopeniophorella convolvens]